MVVDKAGNDKAMPERKNSHVDLMLTAPAAKIKFHINFHLNIYRPENIKEISCNCI